ncbi:MAG TPA: hypothetical protein VG735_07935 [Caulobacterales bacterium]|nr:hypothetical protein [Caulobacterales bacterium]
MPERTAPIVPRVSRDLHVLHLADQGNSPRQIAHYTGLSLDVVQTILKEDAEAFPNEPLGVRT